LKVKAEQMKNRGMEVVDVDSIFNDVDPILVGLSKGKSTLDTGTGEER
jgi:hypothetical protein